MSDDVKTANAEAQESSVESITSQQAIARRLSQWEGKGKGAKPDPKPEPEGETEPEATTTEAHAKEEKAKDVPSQRTTIDLDSLSDEERDSVAEKLRSQAISRYGELTAKRKAAEEETARLREELAKLKNQPDDPLKAEPKANPYSNLKSVDDVKAKAREIDEVIDWAEDALWNTDGMPADHIITEVDGKAVTRERARKMLRDAQKARKEFLPAQLKEIEAKETRKSQKKALLDQARKELPWMDEVEETEAKKQFEGLRNDPVIRRAVEAVPELEPYMEYMTAHAVNSLYGVRKPVSVEASTRKPALTPPSSPDTSVAQSDAPSARTSKAIKELEDRARKTGKVNDIVALRTAQLKRKAS